MIYDGTDVSGKICPWDLLPDSVVDLRDTTVVVMTSYPHDTATFTGSTILRLAAAGARVVLVAMTSDGGITSGYDVQAADSVGLEELVRIARLLGVARLVPLDVHADGQVSVEAAARLVAGICLSECADALVHYDGIGINGDEHRILGHRIGVAAARIARVTSYEATLDQQYLAEVDPRGTEHPLPSAPRVQLLPNPPAITTSVAADVITLTAKRETMLAQASAPAESLDSPRFADIYGLEWFARRGAPNVLDRLAVNA